MKIEKTTLKNGATILGINLPDYNSTTVSFGFKTGSRTEPAELSGMSHFLEHMLFKGSEKRPTTDEISREADAIGAQYNAFTGKEYTAYYIKSESSQFTKALDIIGDMVTTPILSQKELDKERGTIIEEIRMYLDNPLMYLGNFMESTLYGDNGLGRDIAGTEETVKNIQADTMRDYYQEHYNQKNVAIAAVGKLPNNYVEQIAAYIEKMPDGKPTEWQADEFDCKKVGLMHRDISQANIGLMIPGVSIQNDDKYALRVTAAILGGYMSARLFSEIREKRGWAYRIWAYSDNSFDSGYLGIYGGVKKDKTEDSFKLIKKMIENFADDVTAEELKRATGNVMGSSLIKQETTDEIANEALLSFLLTGKTHTPREEAERIAKVTIEDVKTVAKKYLTSENIRLAIIGPFTDKEKFATILAKSN